MPGVEELRPNATAQEIEHEISFVLVLLETLDDEADDFDARKAKYERDLEELEVRLQSAKSRPQTPAQISGNHTSQQPGSGQSFDLPSRPAGSVKLEPPNRSPLQARKTSQRPGGGAYDDPLDDSDGTTASSSSSGLQNLSRKRRRQDSVRSAFSEDAFANKLQRRSDMPALSGASTPASLDSVQQTSLESRAGLKLASGDRSGIMKKVKDRQMQYEARIKMEREDAKIAQSLEAQPSATPSTSFRSSTQSFLDLDGRLISQRVPAESPFATDNVSDGPKMQNGFNSDPRQNGDGRNLLSTPARQLDRVDDRFVADLLEITPAEFLSSVRRHPSSRKPSEYPMSPAVMDHSRQAGTPGYYNSSYRHFPAFAQGRAMEMNVPGAWPSYSSGYASAPPAKHATNPMEHSGPGTDPRYHRSNYPPYGRIPALGGLIDGADTNGRSSLDPWDLAGDLRARGFEYMLNDPTKTREELQKLLENIRPDEDIPPEMRMGTPEALKVPLMEHQKLGLAWLKAQEDGSNKGGILADEMGLGKTIQALALIVSKPSLDPARKTTLILAPVSLMRQWELEIKEKILPRHRLRVFVYHGQRAKNISFVNLASYDIVLTTFGTVAAEFGRKTRSASDSRVRFNSNKFPLLGESSKWFRIIVDEAQFIKNKGTKAAQAACQLVATYRLCMTGTPMMNNVSELYSLIHFLRIPPYNVLEDFNRVFKRPLELGRASSSSKDMAMRALQALLKAILLRRSKDSQIDGKPILNLPARVVEIEHVAFSDDEQSFYDALEQQVQLQVNKYLKTGKIGRNYSYILVRLLRLRQACCHPHLIKDFGIDTDTDVSAEDMEATVRLLSGSVVSMIRETQGAFECPVCYDGVENPIIFFPCGHDMCTECFARMNDPSQAVAEGSESVSDFKCPECRSKVEKKKVFNFTTFKKVHMPEQYEGDFGDILAETVEEDSESASESEAELHGEGDGDEVDSKGNLLDFVVSDDEFDEDIAGMDDDGDSDGDGDDVDAEDANEELDDGSSRGSKKQRKQHNDAKARDKAKGKAKQKREPEKITMAKLKVLSSRNAAAKRRYLRRLRRDWITSSKIDKTMEILKEVQKNDATEKTIIFSQFTSLLDLLEVPISEQGFRYARYDGSISAKLRNEAVSEFQHNPSIKIMLVSLKAGNAGLNLTAASQVIILDPFWNPMIEEQAIDRAHRIGQQRAVQVHRILVKGTVEDRIIELQERKRELINRALDEKAGQSVSRLGIAELSYLFGLNRTLED